MKKIPGWLIGMLAVVGVGVFVSLSQSGTTALYNKEEAPATETAVETVDCMQVVKDEDACKAAEAVIKRKELEAERAELVGQRKLIEAREAEIEKELGF